MINIAYITYDKKKYPIRLRYLALEKFQEETGIKFQEMGVSDEGQKLKYYEPLLFFSLESGAKAIKKELTLKREDMPEVLDECMWEFIQLIPKFMPEPEEEKDTPQESRGQKRQEAKEKKLKNKKLT